MSWERTRCDRAYDPPVADSKGPERDLLRPHPVPWAIDLDEQRPERWMFGPKVQILRQVHLTRLHPCAEESLKFCTSFAPALIHLVRHHWRL